MSATRPFEAYRQRRLAEAEAAFAERLTRGFPTPDFTGQPEPETLQCRDQEDRVRWLGLLIMCQAAILGGHGDALLDVPIRCTSNRQYVVSYADAAQRMNVLLGQYVACLTNLWRLKDAIAACPQRDELNLIDLEEGWP